MSCVSPKWIQVDPSKCSNLAPAKKRKITKQTPHRQTRCCCTVLSGKRMQRNVCLLSNTCLAKKKKASGTKWAARVGKDEIPCAAEGVCGLSPTDLVWADIDVLRHGGFVSCLTTIWHTLPSPDKQKKNKNKTNKHILTNWLSFWFSHQTSKIKAYQMVTSY